MLDELEKIFEETACRDWWRFQYSHRHFQLELRYDEDLACDVDFLLRWLPQVYDELSIREAPLAPDDSDYMTELFEFSNCLVYEFHKQVIADGFIDFKYEALLKRHGNPLRRLKERQIDVNFVEKMHYWTLVSTTDEN